MRTWQQLLLDKVYVAEESAPFGRNGHQVCAAIDTLRAIEWFTHVGTAMATAQVTTVASWESVLVLISANFGSGFGGNLGGPSERCSLSAGDTDYPRHTRVQEGVWEVMDYSRRLPTQLSEEVRERLDDYVYCWSELLFCEILLSDRIDCTYFREQLQWFHAGHFPCGWEGEWPVGKMRVF